MSLLTLNKRILLFAALIIAILTSGELLAQPRSAKTNVDSAQIRTDSMLPGIIIKVASYTSTIDHTSFLLKSKFDITPISLNLPDIEKRIKAFKARLDEKGSQMNLRSLNSGIIILNEISGNLASYQTLLINYSKDLTNSNAEISKILKDSSLNFPLSDSVLSQQIEDIHVEGSRLDSLQKKAIGRVNLLRNKISIALLQATDIVSDMQYLTTTLKLGMWGQEQSQLFNSTEAEYHNSLKESAFVALQRSSKIIAIYLSGKWDIVILALLIFVFFACWVWLNLRRIKLKDNAEVVLGEMHFLNRSALVGCLMALFTSLPFFLGTPPMSLLHACELIRLLCLSWLIFPYLTRPSKIIWLLLSVLWIVYAWDDLLLEASFGERWGLLLLGIILLATCVKILGNKRPHFIRLQESPATKALVILTLTQALLSILFNLTGRVSLAKIFGVSAIQSLVLGLSLKVFCTMVLEAIYLQSEAYQDSRFSEFIDFKNLQHRFLRTLWVLSILAFTLLLLRSFTLYDVVMDTIGAVFNKTRAIGSMVFTFKSVAVFIFIIWLSSIIAGLINFLFGNDKTINTGKRNRIGSMMLLIRLSTWAVGFCIAVAAAGIPVSKLSLMLGALGVGIGFGLQNIVNNLVSGVILAFERPLQIGDLIEVAGKMGVVKEIGVRSSKISNNEGADIIIPNGDLLSQHLTNWTMHDRRRRIEFSIGIPYQADVKMAMVRVTEALASNDKIMQTPAPAISLQQFGATTIEIKIKFWVNELSEAADIKSSVMIQVYEALKQGGIEFPHESKTAIEPKNEQG